jgi:hypothetical protein
MADNQDFERHHDEQQYDDEEESPEHYPEDELHENYDYRDEQPHGVDHKLLNSKEARKKAEEDSRLLSNRISLLKLEERKAWK